MLSTFMGPRPSITLQPYEKLLYLHAPTDFEGLEPSSSSSVAAGHTFGGNVTLSLPKAREIASLLVKLVTYYTINIPGHGSESGVLEEYSTQLTVPHKLDKGEHTYPWSLNIPHDSAPYERCAYGRVYTRLHAVADGPEGTLKTEIPLEIIVNPAPEGEMFGLHETIEGFNEEIGPYRMTLSSEQVTVGGAVHFVLQLAALPAHTNIYSISAHVSQSYSLTSPARPNITCSPTAHERQIFVLDGRTVLNDPGKPMTVVRPASEPPKDRGILASVKKGRSFELSHVARMPDDDLLRATTQQPSKAPICLSHQVLFELRFSTQGSNAIRALRAKRRIVISSCRCMLESVILPPYDDSVGGSLEDDGGGRRGRGPRFRCPGECVCSFTLERLLAKQHSQMLKEHESATRLDVMTSDALLIANKVTRPPAVASA